MKIHRTFGPMMGGIFAVISSPALPASNTSVTGTWLTDDQAAIVRIDRCGESICGVIERVLDPKAPKNDINNPDRNARSEPLVGTTVLSGFKRSGDQWVDGKAYDPKAGRSYRSSLELDRNGTLKLTGCVLFICQSRYWMRH